MHNYTIMIRERILLPLLIGGLFVGVTARQGLQAASDPDVIEAKAQELSSKHTITPAVSSECMRSCRMRSEKPKRPMVEVAAA